MESEMASRPRKAVIGITSCRMEIRNNEYDCVSRFYAEAVLAAGGLPLSIPALGDALDVEALLETVDGLLFTGSPSNVEPRHYGGAQSEEGTWHDPARDATTLPLLRTVLDRGVPFLAICRGYQELNVVLGGTLHQKVQELDGKMDHRAREGASLEEKFALAHEIELVEGGLLRDLAGRSSVAVNSVHAQGLDRLGEGLEVEAYAPDGLVEAVSVKDAKAFALGVQWHPEWNVRTNDLSAAIFKAFGDACSARAAR